MIKDLESELLVNNMVGHSFLDSMDSHQIGSDCHLQIRNFGPVGQESENL